MTNQMPEISHDRVMAAREKVNAAFDGFIGNEDAVYAIKRSMIVALSASPLPIMDRTFLLSGPPSTGKSEMARRITVTLGVPFVRIDGRAVRNRERLFEMIDEALHARGTGTTRAGERAGVPVIEYPPFSVMIDEIHLVGERTQEAFLTMLEQDDRTLVLDGEAGRRVALVAKAAWIFATTKPADLDRAFRSRCIEIQLRRYTAEEVEAMVRARFPMLPISVAETISTCSRLVPRQAFDMARDVVDEVLTAEDGGMDIRACVRRVMHGRGILFANGVARDDLRYLEALKREHRPMGETALMATLYDVDPVRVREDIEPYLLMLGYISMTQKGRQISQKGLGFLDQVREGTKAERK